MLIKFKIHNQRLNYQKTTKVKFKSTNRQLKNLNCHLLTIKKNRIWNLKA
jgi:hypothetical protein